MRLPMLNARLSTVARIVILNLSVVQFVVAPFTAKADVQFKLEESSITIRITGTISEHDAKSVQELIPELEHKSLELWLVDSRGGDVFAAIAIGRIVRKYEGNIWVSGKCYSSCALIFISGVRRDLLEDGELGLHRPYFASAPQNREVLEKQVPLMLSMVKSYVAEMGITDNFYQLMVNTAPSQIVVYRSDNFNNSYSKIVPKIDPIYDEILAARKAREFGITTSEARKRESEADRCKL